MRGVWKPESIVVQILSQREKYSQVHHKDYGIFWTPTREIHVFDRK